MKGISIDLEPSESKHNIAWLWVPAYIDNL